MYLINRYHMYLSGRKHAQTYKSQQHTASVSPDVSRRADDNARPKRRGPGPAEGAGAVERHLARARNGAGGGEPHATSRLASASHCRPVTTGLLELWLRLSRGSRAKLEKGLRRLEIEAPGAPR